MDGVTDVLNEVAEGAATVGQVAAAIPGAQGVAGAATAVGALAGAAATVEPQVLAAVKMFEAFVHFAAHSFGLGGAVSVSVTPIAPAATSPAASG